SPPNILARRGRTRWRDRRRRHHGHSEHGRGAALAAARLTEEDSYAERKETAAANHSGEPAPALPGLRLLRTHRRKPLPPRLEAVRTGQRMVALRVCHAR